MRPKIARMIKKNNVKRIGNSGEFEEVAQTTARKPQNDTDFYRNELSFGAAQLGGRAKRAQHTAEREHTICV